MAIHDYIIDNQSAPAFRADLNGALQAIVTQNSNATAPTTTYANMIWYDTAANQLKKRNEANSAWIVLGTIDETLGTFNTSGTPAIATQAEAQAGTDNTKMMTPLRSSQAIAALGGATTLLGTLTTTSGTTQTLSGLVLTSYKFLVISVNAVSSNASTSVLFLNGSSFAVLTAGAVAQTGSGGGFVDLASGVYWSSSGNTSGNVAPSYGGASGLSNASTSITFAVGGGAVFDAGSIRIYGVK